MPSSVPARRFQDILDNIGQIRAYQSSTDKAQFMDGGMAYDAISYCFVRLTEAAIKLGDLAETMAPDIPWNNIRGLGNHLRHAYDGINPGVLWDTADIEFPRLEQACLAAIAALDVGGA